MAPAKKKPTRSTPRRAKRPRARPVARPAPRVQYLVFTWVPDELLEEWNEWHNTVHIPNVLRTPQMRGARKYRLSEVALPGEWPFQYVTIYELDSVEDFHAYRTGPGPALRKEHDARWGDVARIARVMISADQRVL